MVRDKTLYNRLNVPPDADDATIKKAYRKLSMKWHPDKNKEKDAKDKFQDISEAYSILSDNKKRNMYDQIGMDYVKNGEGGPSIDPSQMFEQFFGGMGGGFPFPFGGMGGMGDMGGMPNKENENCVIEKPVSLEELYNGATVKINYSQKNYCKFCDGTGSKTKKLNKCNKCNGKGKILQQRQLGPGMVQQVVLPCNGCDGSGEFIGSNNKCSQCDGKTFFIKNKSLDIPLKKGLTHGNKIQLSNKGHIFKSGRTDLIIVILEKKHDTFIRDNFDLHTHINISLYQDLFGFSKVIKHLDNREILIQHNNMVENDCVLLVRNEGMIQPNGIKGSLFVHVKTKFPNLNNLEDNEKTILKKLLIKANLKDNKEEQKVIENIKSYQKTNSILINQNESSREDSRNHSEDEGGVQCAQQ